MTRELLIFMKPPRLGAVKTRLAATLGDRNALAVYRALATAAIARTRPGRPGAFDRTVCFDAPDAAAAREVAVMTSGEKLEPQVTGDIGARMHAAFAGSFARGSTASIVIGSDCPAIDTAKIEDAFDELRRRDLVLRAATDGGYTLIGLRQPTPRLFEDLPWSMPALTRLTLARAESLGLRVRILGTDVDIDTADDLRDAWSLVAPLLQPPFAAELKRLLPPEPKPPLVADGDEPGEPGEPPER
jgi:hypothetical protein